MKMIRKIYLQVMNLELNLQNQLRKRFQIKTMFGLFIILYIILQVIVVNENDKNGLTVKWHFTWQKIEPYFWDTWDWNWILWGGDLESLPHKVQFHIKFVAICYSFAIISYKILHLLAGNVCYHVYIINIYTITNIPR